MAQATLQSTFCPWISGRVGKDWQPGMDISRRLTHVTPLGPRLIRRQIRCWKRTARPVDLASSGGHEAVFEGRRVFPMRFLSRHYPIRGEAHGERKIFEDRRPRFMESELARGWHVPIQRGQAWRPYDTRSGVVDEIRLWRRQAVPADYASRRGNSSSQVGVAAHVVNRLQSVYDRIGDALREGNGNGLRTAGLNALNADHARVSNVDLSHLRQENAVLAGDLTLQREQGALAAQLPELETPDAAISLELRAPAQRA